MKATTYLSLSLAISLWCTCLVQAQPGPVHLWTFDEGTGTEVADAVGGQTGSVNGATWAAGQIGGALKFDGIDDYAALPDNEPVWLPSGSFTISFWVYFERDKGTSVHHSEVLVDLNYGASSDPSYELGYNVQRRGDTGRIAFQMTTMANTDEDLYSQTVPVKGRWYHIAAVRKGAVQEIYIDGEPDSWRVCSPTPIDFVGGYDDDKVSVGRYTTTVGEPRYHLKGMLDELAIFDRGLSSQEVRRLYQDGPGICNLYVDAARGRDWYSGRRPSAALATIQRAVDLAKAGDVIGVYPGVYCQEVRFMGKAVTVRSIGDAAFIEVPGGTGVSFYMREGPQTVLQNMVIRNCDTGIFCNDSSPTISNVTVVENAQGAQVYGRTVLPHISNSIFWGNSLGDLYGCRATYSCIERGSQGQGNFSEAPLFVDPENGDYHLRSTRGRYWPEHDVWVLDDISSPCIDAGDPAADFSDEPKPSGGRLNVGAHGGTAYAEMSDPAVPGDISGDGVFDIDDYYLFMDLWQQYLQPPTGLR